MKSIIATLAIVLGSSMAFAQHGAAHGAPAGGGDMAAASGKMTKKEARTSCKSEGKKGKELKACVKEKTM